MVIGGVIQMRGFLKGSVLFACCTLAMPATSFAATQGSVGATSTGTVGISATVPGRVQISGLNDIVFGTVDPAVGAASAEDVCVWSNTSGKGYTVTATGSGASNAFSLSDGTNSLAYAVEWAGTAGQSTGTALISGTALSGLSSTATNPTCSSGPAASASLVVKMTAADLQAAVASSYTGTLTLVVAPQ
jgi:spore coat protein U-like protein